MTIEGDGGTVTRFVAEADFDEYKDKNDARQHGTRVWLGWVTALAAILVIICAIQFKINSYLLTKNEQLTQTVKAQKDLLGTKVDLGTVTALVAKKTAPIDTIRTDLAKVRGQVGFVATKIHEVEGTISAEDFVTLDGMDAAIAEVRAQQVLATVEARRVLADSLAAIRAVTTAQLQSYTAQQERSFQLLRTSVAADISSVKLANRAALGFGIINTAWQAVHVNSNRR